MDEPPRLSPAELRTLFLFEALEERSESTRLNSSHTVIYTLSLHDALPISPPSLSGRTVGVDHGRTPSTESRRTEDAVPLRSAGGEIGEHTSELQSHRDLHSFPTRRSSDLSSIAIWPNSRSRSWTNPLD